MTLSQKEFDAVDKIQIIWARGQVTVTQSQMKRFILQKKRLLCLKQQK